MGGGENPVSGVLLLDFDPQGHLTLELGFPKNLRVTLKNMLENIIMGVEFDPREAILKHREGIEVVPSNKLLTGMDMSLITVDDREKVLKEYSELLVNDYDYIIIDCMPSLGMLTINAMSAADRGRELCETGTGGAESCTCKNAWRRRV